jgi:hypothetical protein
MHFELRGSKDKENRQKNSLKIFKGAAKQSQVGWFLIQFR